MRPLAAGGPAKPLKTGQAGADEAAFAGGVGAGSARIGGADLSSRRCGGYAKVPIRERDAAKRRERVLRDGALRAPSP